MPQLKHCMLCNETENLKQTATHALLVCPRCTGNHAHAFFTLGGTPPQYALYDPTDLWNGWHNPLFTIEQAKKIISYMAANGNFLYEEDSYSTDGVNIYYHLHDTNWRTYDGSTPKKMNTEQVMPEIINGVKYYKIGYWSWCWQACATLDEANEITN